MAPPLVTRLPKVTEYVRNVGKSVQFAAVDYLKDTMPDTHDFIETNQELFKDIASAVKDYKGTLKAADKSIRRSKIYEAGSELKKTLFDSIRTGKFYDPERENYYRDKAGGSLGDMSDMDDWGFDTNQFDIDDGSGDISTNDSTSILSSTVKDATTAQASVIAKSSEYLAEMNKANTKLLFAQGEKLYSAVSGGLAGTQAMLDKVNQFLYGPLTAHIENSKTFFESALPAIEQINKSVQEIAEMQRNLYKREQEKDKESQYSLVGGSSPDLREYAKQVKKNFMEFLGPEAQMLFGNDMGDGNMLMSLVANPLAAIPNYVVKTIIPATVKKSLETIDATFSNLFANIIARLNHAAKDDFSNPILNFLGRIFGLRVDKKSTYDTSKYEKGPVPFDGITRKSIVEIIPGHLARIEAALTGRGERVFDYETGKWTTAKKVKEKHDYDRRRNVEDAFWETGGEVRENISRYRRSKDENSRKRADELEQAYRILMNKIYEDEGDFRPYDKHRFGDTKVNPWVYYGLDRDTYMQLAHWLVGTKDNPKSTAYKIGPNVLRAKESLAKDLREQERRGYSNQRYLYNNSYDFSTDKERGTGISNILTEAKDKYQKNIFWYLRGIYAEISTIRQSGGFGGSSSRGGGPLGPSPDPRLVVENRLQKEIDEAEYKRRQEEAAKNVGTTNEDYLDIEQDIENKDTVKYAKKIREKGKSFLNELLEANSVGAKFRVIQSNIRALTEAPANILSGVIGSADRQVFKLLFGGQDPDKFKDDEGRTAKGLLDYMILNVKRTFDNINEKIDAGLEALKKKLGIESFSELFKRLADRLGLTKAAGFVKDKVKQWSQPTIDRIKEKMGWGWGQFKGSMGRTYGAAWNKVKGYLPAPAPYQMSDEDIEDFLNRNGMGANIIPTAQGTTVSADDDEEDYSNYNFARGGLITRRGLAVVSPGERVVPVGGKITQRNNLIAEKAFARRLGLPKGLSFYASGTKDTTDEELERAKQVVQKVTSEVTGDTKHKGVANVIASSLLGGGFSLLTGLIGGPLLGAAAGAAFGITQNSGTVQNMLFGEEIVDKDGNPTGERKGGLISADIQKKFKKYFPSMRDFGLAGAVAGLFTPFGLVGGLMAGSAIGFAKENEGFQEWLFGKKDKETGERDGGLISKEFRDKVKKAAPRMLIGAAGAALLGPFGLIGNAALGSALGLVTTTDSFQKAVFGEDDGTGKKKGGILPAIYRGIVKPLYKTGKKFVEGAKEFFDKKIAAPVKEAIPAIIQMIKNGITGIGDHVKDFLSGMFERTIGRPLADFLEHTIFDNVRKWTRRILKAPLALAKGLISAPFSALGFIGNNIRHSQIAKGTAGDMTAQQRLDWRNKHSFRVFGKEIISHDKFRNLDEKLAGLKGQAGVDRMKQMREQMKLYLDTRGEVGQQAANKVREAGQILSDFLNGNNSPDGEATIYQRTGSRLVKGIHKAIKDGDINLVARGLQKIMAKGFMTPDQYNEILTQLSPIVNQIAELREKQKNSKDYQKQLQGRLGRLTGGALSNTKNIRRFSRLLDKEIDSREAEIAKEKAENPEKAAADTINESIDRSTKSIVDVLMEINENIKLNGMTKKEKTKYLQEKAAAEAADEAADESYEDDGLFSGDTDTDTESVDSSLFGRAKSLGRGLKNKLTFARDKARGAWYKAGAKYTIARERIDLGISNAAASIKDKSSKMKQFGEFITGGEKDIKSAFKNAFHMVTTKDGRAALANAKGKILGTSGASAVGKEIKEEAAADKLERKTLLDSVKGIGTSIIGGAGKLIGKAKDGIFSMISGIVNNTGIVGKAIKLLGGLGFAAIAVAGVGHFSELWKTKLWPTLKKWFGGIFDKIKGVASSIYGWLSETFPSFFGEDSFIGKAVTRIKEFFEDPGAGIKKMFRGIVDWFKEGFSLFNENILIPAWNWISPRLTTLIYNAIHSSSLAEAINSSVDNKSVKQNENQRVDSEGNPLYYDENGNTTTDRYDASGNEREAVIDSVSVVETKYDNSIRNFDLGHMSRKEVQKEATIGGLKFTYLEYENGDIVIRSENTGEYIRINGGLKKAKQFTYGILKDATGQVSNGALIASSVGFGAAGAIAGGILGAMAAGAISGTTIGTAVGTVLPGIGNVIGAVAGVLIGAGAAFIGYTLSGGGEAAESKISMDDVSANPLLIGFGLDPSGENEWPVVSDAMKEADTLTSSDSFHPDYSSKSTSSNNAIKEVTVGRGGGFGETKGGGGGFTVDDDDSGSSRKRKRAKARDHLYQGDPMLENVKFGNSTLGKAGCAPVAAANLMGGNLAYTTALAEKYQTSDGGVTPDYFSNTLGGVQTDSKKSMMNAIKSGRPTVLLGRSSKEQGTPFGANDHYITAMGMDRRGNILVDDPDLPGSRYKYPASKVMNDTTTGVITGMRRGLARRRGMRRRYGFGPNEGGDPSIQKQKVSKIAAKAYDIIHQSEGNYGSINEDDNGALSIGKIQWHGCRAHDLLIKIISAVGTSRSQQILGTSLYNEIVNKDRNYWNTRVVTKSEGEKLSELISTEEGKSIQDLQGYLDIENYISVVKGYGITNENAIVYFCDMYNQSPAAAQRVAKNAISAKGSASSVTLEDLYNTSLTDSVFSKYSKRRTNCYNMLKNSGTVGNGYIELEVAATMDFINATGSLSTVDGFTGTGIGADNSATQMYSGLVSGGLDLARIMYGDELVNGMIKFQQTYGNNKNNSMVGASSGSFMNSSVFGGSSTYVPANGYGTVGSPTQQGLVDQMASIKGKINYSLDWDKQDPDIGVASCASTVGWAYRKVLGLNNPKMSASSTDQSQDTRFKTLWTNQGTPFKDDALLQPGDVMYFNWDRTKNNGTMQHTEMYAGNSQDWSHGGEPQYGPVLKDLGDYRRKHLMMVRRYNGFLGNDASGSSRRRGYARAMTAGVSANISDNAKKVISQYGISTSSQSPRYGSVTPSDGAQYNQFLAVIIDLLAAIADNTKGLTDLQKSLSNRGVDVDYSTLEKAAANARRRSARARANSVGGYKPMFTPASTFDSASAQDLMNSPTGFMVQAMEALAIE